MTCVPSPFCVIVVFKISAGGCRDQQSLRQCRGHVSHDSRLCNTRCCDTECRSGSTQSEACSEGNRSTARSSASPAHHVESRLLDGGGRLCLRDRFLARECGQIHTPRDAQNKQ